MFAFFQKRRPLTPQYRKKNYLILFTVFALLFSGCAMSPTSTKSAETRMIKLSDKRMHEVYASLPEQSSPQTVTIGNEFVMIDISNVALGYFAIRYLGDNPKVKLMLTGPDTVKYTYNITTELVYLPVSGGNGTYSVKVYENISGDDYASAYSGSFGVTLENEFLPYLYSNLYVNYAKAPNTQNLAQELFRSCDSDLAYVSSVYHYLINNVTYDKEKAATVSYLYLPVLDDVLAHQTGICFDYASLMAGMLRSCGIPTKLQIGYAGTAYHAWISTYISDVGWIDGIIHFDGKNWSLLDPTFAAGSNDDAVKEFIGDGSNYNVLYSY